MGGPCATGSESEISATGVGAISGSITTGSLTDSNEAEVSATGWAISSRGAGVSNTGVEGSNAVGVQAGSGVMGIQAGSVHTGVSAKTGSSFGAAGISSTLSMTCGSPTELNSATPVIGAATTSRSKSETIGF